MPFFASILRQKRRSIPLPAHSVMPSDRRAPVHAQRHALGLAVYELTAIVRLHPEGWEDAVAGAIDGYMDMLTRAEGEALLPRRWADFLK